MSRADATPLRAMLFDLDGTLVDTAPDLAYAANCVRESLQLPPLPLPEYRPVASAGARGLLGKALGITPEHPDFPRHRDSFLALYRKHLSRASCLFEGMDEVLRAMEQRGIHWGVVTNKPAWLTAPLMQDLRLAERASCSVSADEVAQAKPAPDALFEACKRMNVAPEHCIYVGDDLRDIVAGKAAGMRTIAADWGYLGEGGPIESWGADAIARIPADLQQWLPG